MSSHPTSNVTGILQTIDVFLVIICDNGSSHCILSCTTSSITGSNSCSDSKINSAGITSLIDLLLELLLAFRQEVYLKIPHMANNQPSCICKKIKNRQ